ncbi:carbamoyl phosphate synthase small subunit [Beduini massiliensis]|uniref:carbamoyl phosphate synthase small subunit n=1 Tax=Beduini massiliensis TaxID=1585974 RepID=UPI00059AA21B|nr:carbamoyl phosphate synthase small subunit [Beduini massiliensis]
MKAYLILENGDSFEGISIGAKREVVSELVFNTSMSGYLEILTDPSYAGQSVIMTYPLIGNYGVCLEDQESSSVFTEGLIVSELSRIGSNFRTEMDLDTYLKLNDIPGIAGVDTRHLAKVIRQKGCLNGMITTQKYENIQEVLPQIKAYKVEHVVEKVTSDSIHTISSGNKKIALYDFGAKRNIAEHLIKRGYEVIVVPASTPAKKVIAMNVDGILLSNGPGDPSECTEIIGEIKQLIKSGIPIFGICLGHQLMALAQGFKTEKLKYGHHGANHPVKNLINGHVYISTQNHNYVIKESSIDASIAKVWFMNVNDQTIEGLKYHGQPIQTVQFHPEACAGPQDTEFLFDEFTKMIEERR